jgi:hypothetical protein
LLNIEKALLLENQQVIMNKVEDNRKKEAHVALNVVQQ